MGQKRVNDVFDGMWPFLKVLEMYEGKLRFFVMTGERPLKCFDMAGVPEFSVKSTFDATKLVTFLTLK